MTTTAKATWLNHIMWSCHRHLPTSKVYPKVMEFCPSCKQPRPSMNLCPEAAPPPEADIPSNVVVLRTSGCPDRLYSTVCPDDFLTGDPQELFSMVSDEVRKELDGEVLADLINNSNSVKELPDHGAKGVQLGIGREPPAPFSPQVTYDPEFLELPKAKKARCPGPECLKYARSNSPYCSKICSDRCLRLRNKAAKGTLTGTDIPNHAKIVRALENWGK